MSWIIYTNLFSRRIKSNGKYQLTAFNNRLAFIANPCLL